MLDGIAEFAKEIFAFLTDIRHFYLGDLSALAYDLIFA